MKKKPEEASFLCHSFSSIFVDGRVVRLWVEHLSHIAKMQWQIEGNLLLHRNHVIKHSSSLEHNRPQIQFTQVPALGTSRPACLTHRHTQANGWFSTKQFRHTISSVLGLDPQVPAVASSRVLWSLQHPAQSYGCFSSCVPNLMHACRILRPSTQENNEFDKTEQAALISHVCSNTQSDKCPDQVLFTRDCPP